MLFEIINYHIKRPIMPIKFKSNIIEKPFEIHKKTCEPPLEKKNNTFFRGITFPSPPPLKMKEKKRIINPTATVSEVLYLQYYFNGIPLSHQSKWQVVKITSERKWHKRSSLLQIKFNNKPEFIICSSLK